MKEVSETTLAPILEKGTKLGSRCRRCRQHRQCRLCGCQRRRLRRRQYLVFLARFKFNVVERKNNLDDDADDADDDDVLLSFLRTFFGQPKLFKASKCFGDSRPVPATTFARFPGRLLSSSQAADSSDCSGLAG